MKMEVWADFLCPYCYVSIQALDRALKETGTTVDYVHRAYRLKPDLEFQTDRGHFEWMAEHLDMTLEEAKASVKEGIGQKAKEQGIPFHPEKARPADTTAAHLLALAANKKGLAQQTVTRLARGYYELGENLSDPDVLDSIAKEVGLSDYACSNIREDTDRLEEDRKAFDKTGAESVPHYRINDETELPESKSVEEFIKILKKYD